MTRSVKHRRHRALAGRGALFILACLLAGSGALRLGAGFGEAMARTETSHQQARSPAPLDCPPPPLAVTQALLAREAMLQQRETALADRIAALSLTDQVVQNRIATLQKIEAEVSETLARADGAAEADLTRLTAIYQAMKPKDAAHLFGTMAPEFAAGFLGRMQPESAGAILAGMPADTAYAISVLLAGRNALVPKN